jgi:site-specific recombinase XerD
MIDTQNTLNLFIKQLEEEGKTQSTLLAYGKDIEQFLALINKIHIQNLDEIEEAHIKLFLESLEKQNYTPKSVSRKLNSIRTFCKIMNGKKLYFEILNINLLKTVLDVLDKTTENIRWCFLKMTNNKSKIKWLNDELEKISKL